MRLKKQLIFLFFIESNPVKHLPATITPAIVDLFILKQQILKLLFTFLTIVSISTLPGKTVKVQKFIIGSIETDTGESIKPLTAICIHVDSLLKNGQENLKRHSNTKASFPSLEAGIYKGSCFLRARGQNIVSTALIEINGNKIGISTAAPGASCNTKCCSSSTTECIHLSGGICTRCSCGNCTRTPTSLSILLKQYKIEMLA